MGAEGYVQTIVAIPVDPIGFCACSRKHCICPTTGDSCIYQ